MLVSVEKEATNVRLRYLIMNSILLNVSCLNYVNRQVETLIKIR